MSILQLVESESVAHDAKVNCHQQDIPFYRFSPQLREEISLGETNPDLLVNMIVTARAYIASHPEFDRMIDDIREISEAHEVVYKK